MSDALEQRLEHSAHWDNEQWGWLREAAAELVRLREALAQAERERDELREALEVTRGAIASAFDGRVAAENTQVEVEADLAACREALHRIAEEPVLGGTPVTFERLAEYRRDLARAVLAEAAATKEQA